MADLSVEISKLEFPYHRARPDRFIVLKDSVSYLNFFRFKKKILELFEYHGGHPYMTAIRNSFAAPTHQTGTLIAHRETRFRLR